jgi:tRNA(Ile)-lysidine synthase
MELLIEIAPADANLLAEVRRDRPPNQELIDADRLRPPLVVRRWRAGDRFHPLGAPGSKKVGDWLTDHKVPMHDRDRVLLLCDQLGPVWLIPHRIDDRVRVTARTRRVARLKLMCEQ